MDYNILYGYRGYTTGAEYMYSWQLVLDADTGEFIDATPEYVTGDTVAIANDGCGYWYGEIKSISNGKARVDVDFACITVPIEELMPADNPARYGDVTHWLSTEYRNPMAGE